MGEPGAPRAGTRRDEPQTVPRRAGTATWHPRDAGEWLGWGTWGSQAAKHGPAPRNTAGFRTSQSSKGQITTSLCWGSSGLGFHPGESREKLLFGEPSEAPSGKGSPGEGHLPPRRTQDVSSALSRTGRQRAGKAVLEGAEG